MQNIDRQKLKVKQKKNRLLAEETKLKIKERKMRTRKLIELGGLVIKAALDHLPSNTLYGGLLSLKQSLETDFDSNLQKAWTRIGKQHFEKEQQEKIPVIIKFDDASEQNIRAHIRDLGLKWNQLRQEWYGYTTNISSLESILTEFKHDLQIIA